MKYCTSCGKELNDRAKFCTGCGTKCAVDIEDNIQPAQIPQEPPQGELPNAESACREAVPANDATPEEKVGQENPIPQVEPEQQSEPITPPMKKRRHIPKGKIILFSILGVVLVVVISAAVLLFRWYASTELEVQHAPDGKDNQTTIAIMEENNITHDTDDVDISIKSPQATEDESLSKSVSLSSLNIFNCEAWPNWNTGIPQDPFGNDYSSKSNFAIFESSQGMEWESSFRTYTAHAEYRVANEYKTISGVLAPYSGTKEGANAYLQIYADETLIYTSPYVTRKTDAFSFSVNISGAEYITLCVILENDGSNYWFGEYSHYSSMVLSDVLLTRNDTTFNETPSSNITLNSLGEFNHTAWPKWNDGYPKDMIDTDYSAVKNYVIFESSRDMEFRGDDHTYYASAEYKVNGEFSTLSGTIAPYTSANIDSKAYVYIYADEELVYTSPCIEGRSNATPFSVDIRNAKYITIEVVLHNDGSYYWFGEYAFYSALILSDIMLIS